MSGPAVAKFVNETRDSLPFTEYGVSLGTVGIAWPVTSTGICQARLPSFVLKAWIAATPFGYCEFAITRPISVIPLPIVFTALAHEDALPFAIPPVDTSSCFHTILFVDGSNATNRATVSVVGVVVVRSCVMLPNE